MGCLPFNTLFKLCTPFLCNKEMKETIAEKTEQIAKDIQESLPIQIPVSHEAVNEIIEQLTPVEKHIDATEVVLESIEEHKVVKDKEAVVQEAVAQEAVVQEAVSKEAVVQEAVAKDAVAKEAVAKEAVAKEAVAKEAVAKEAVAKEAVSE